MWYISYIIQVQPKSDDNKGIKRKTYAAEAAIHQTIQFIARDVHTRLFLEWGTAKGESLTLVSGITGGTIAIRVGRWSKLRDREGCLYCKHNIFIITRSY